jgi:hypothetical protein
MLNRKASGSDGHEKRWTRRPFGECVQLVNLGEPLRDNSEYQLARRLPQRKINDIVYGILLTAISIGSYLQSDIIGCMSPIYQPGDHVKVEFAGDSSGESKWMWVQVESSDDEDRIVFGRLDSQPVLHSELTVGQDLAVSYDKIRDHRRFERSQS